MKIKRKKAKEIGLKGDRCSKRKQIYQFTLAMTPIETVAQIYQGK